MGWRPEQDVKPLLKACWTKTINYISFYGAEIYEMTRKIIKDKELLESRLNEKKVLS